MIYERRADDDTDALLIANAIEDWGGTVICLTPNGQKTYMGAVAPHTEFIVWFRVIDHKHGDRIDKAMNKTRDNYAKKVAKKRKELKQ